MFGLAAVGVLASSISQLALTWDGSYILLNVLWTQAPFAPHERWTNIIVQAPVVVLSKWIGDPTTLGILFSACYAVIPLISLAASWYVVRNESRLFIWPAVGIGLVSLPGQAFFVSEAMFSAQLFWPVLLAIAIGLPARTIWLVVVLSLAIGFAHPIGIVLLVGAAAACFINQRKVRKTHSWWALTAFLVAAALLAVRFLLTKNAYESDQISLSALQYQTRASLASGPLIGLGATYAGGLALLVAKLLPSSIARLIRSVAIMAFLLAAGSFIGWAADPHAWTQTLEYRGLMLFASMPIYVMAFTDAGAAGRPELDRLVRGPLKSADATSWVAIATWVCVLSIQSLSWHNTLADFRMYMTDTPTACVPESRIHGVDKSPLHHWSITPLSLLISGRVPAQIVLPGTQCGMPLTDGFPIGDFEVRHWDARWFDNSPLQRILILQHVR